MSHIPVLKEKIQFIFEKLPVKSVIDVTFGAGGHSEIFLKNNCKVIALDRDKTVLKFSEIFKNNSNFQIFIDCFSNILKYSKETDIIFGDLGMSTMQLEGSEGKTGFSFMKNTELDMRMGENGSKLNEIINNLPVFELEKILRDYAEEKNYKVLANNIVKYRLAKKITTTFDLIDAIKITQYANLARIFQAFRIYINSELLELENLLSSGFPIVKEGMFFITFHSLEDRIVKNFFRTHFKFRGFILPSEEEIKINPKSRSAKLRFGFHNYSITSLLKISNAESD